MPFRIPDRYTGQTCTDVDPPAPNIVRYIKWLAAELATARAALAAYYPQVPDETAVPVHNPERPAERDGGDDPPGVSQIGKAAPP